MLDAAKWIKDGKIYRIGHNYEQAMPLFGKRAFTLRIPGSPTGGPFGENGWSTTTSSSPPRSARSAPSSTASATSASRSARRATDRDDFYNGHTAAEFSDAYGLKKLGVEN